MNHKLSLIVAGLLILTGALTSQATSTLAAAATPLRAEDVARAEKLLARLRLLGAAADAGEDPRAFRALARKFYPQLFVAVAEMRASDLKAEIDTAAFLYEEVGQVWSASRDTAADCDGERRELYRALCRGLRGGTARQLLVAKSLLHVRWAEAIVKDYRARADAETARALSEMRAARADDLLIAAHVVEMMRRLERDFNASAAGSAEAARRDLSRGAADSAGGVLATDLSEVEALLASVSRDALFYQLLGASHCLRNALYWNQQVQQSRQLVVSAAAGFAPDPLKSTGLPEEQVSQTIDAYWRGASESTRRAEEQLRQSRATSMLDVSQARRN